jgi:hypothetical protein
MRVALIILVWGTLPVIAYYGGKSAGKTVEISQAPVTVSTSIPTTITVAMPFVKMPKQNIEPTDDEPFPVGIHVRTHDGHTGTVIRIRHSKDETWPYIVCYDVPDYNVDWDFMLGFFYSANDLKVIPR